jgi:hypothetical protein
LCGGLRGYCALGALRGYLLQRREVKDGGFFDSGGRLIEAGDKALRCSGRQAAFRGGRDSGFIARHECR